MLYALLSCLYPLVLAPDTLLDAVESCFLLLHVLLVYLLPGFILLSEHLLLVGQEPLATLTVAIAFCQLVL